MKCNLKIILHEIQHTCSFTVNALELLSCHNFCQLLLWLLMLTTKTSPTCHANPCLDVHLQKKCIQKLMYRTFHSNTYPR